MRRTLLILALIYTTVYGYFNLDEILSRPDLIVTLLIMVITSMLVPIIVHYTTKHSKRGD